MTIRRAAVDDLAAINRLLRQVLDVHHAGRPDLFLEGSKKYTDEELIALIGDDERPIFVAQDEQGDILGYAFCVHEKPSGNRVLLDPKTLYIDDLCVDESMRGRHVGKTLYEYVVRYAKSCGCIRLTLNVWSCNKSAMAFYACMGLTPYRVGMEQLL